MRDRIQKIIWYVRDTLTHFGWLALVTMPLFFIVNWAVFTTSNAEHETISTRLISAADNDFTNIELFVNNKLSSIHDDFHIILDSDETVNYLSNPTPTTYDDYQQLIYRITSNKASFLRVQVVQPNGNVDYELRYIDDTLVENTNPSTNIANTYDFIKMLNMNPEMLYISNLHLIDHQPVLSLLKPLIHDNHVESYLIIHYDANDFLSVLGIYSNDEASYLSFGLMSDNDLWLINQENLTLTINLSAAYRADILDRIVHNRDILTYYFSIPDESNHFYVNETGNLRFYITLDIQGAIADSNSLMLKYPSLIAIGANVIALVLIVYIAYMVRTRKDDRMLINANTYLSIQNTDCVVIVDHHLHITYVNQAFENIFGYTYDEAYLKHIKSLIGIEQLPLGYHRKDDLDYDGHVWNKTKSGLIILRYLRIKRQKSFAGQEKHYIGIHSNSRIEIDDFNAYLKNKTNTLNVLTKYFETEMFMVGYSTLVLIRITHADTIEFANHLKNLLDDHYTIVMPQNDHVFLYANLDDDQFDIELNKIDNFIERFRYLPKTNRNFKYVFSIARADQTVDTAEYLVESAIISLAYTRENPYQKYQVYQHYIKTFIERQRDIESELENGFSHLEFHLEYQVQMDLNNQQYIGTEALLRWHNQRLGIIPPAEFVPVIEHSFYINKLSLMVLSLAIRDFESFMDELPENFRISINLCSFDLSNDYIIKHLIQQIEESELSTSQFVFEITESQYIHNVERTNKIIDLLHQKGILIAIDDFGTGYSSINLLKRIKVDYVKIDRSFIKDYPQTDDGHMLNSIVTLVHGFNKKIIVEGTESKEQMDYVINNQCEYAQGYFISKPLPVALFKERYSNLKQMIDQSQD